MYLNMHANYPLLLYSLAFHFFCSTNVLNLEVSFTTLLDQQSAKSYACGLSLMYWIAHCSICLAVNYTPHSLVSIACALIVNNYHPHFINF